MHIVLNQLKKAYKSADGIIQAVNDASLDIPENTIFGIIGKSGAGKSSLVRLISLLEQPDSGEVYYNNRRVDNLSKKELILERRKIGMIFQNFNLFSSRTAGKNVSYPLELCKTPKEEIRARVKEMLGLVGLKDKEDAPISTLSGGQKQRVAIARALATKPDILFCDEATSALDPQTTRSILELIRDIQAKMNLTVVMITHQMEVVRDACEQVAVIDEGKIVEQGPVSRIFSSPQTEITKDFLSNLSADSKEIIRWSKEGGKFMLHFIGDSTGKPVLSSLAHKFNIEFNIRAAGIQHLKDTQVGTMIADINGEKEELEKALSYLKESGVNVEESK